MWRSLKLRRKLLHGLVVLPVACLTLLFLPSASGATENSLKEILQLVFERAAAKEADFRPYGFRRDGRTRVWNGDDELEEETRLLGRYVRWSADSTETVEEKEEVIFSSEGEEAEKVDGKDAESTEGEEHEEKMSFDMDFWSPEKRKLYRFQLEGPKDWNGREAVVLKLRPKKKRKELWKGLVWLDPRTGALLATDLEPAKRRFGMKSMRVRKDYKELDDMSVPARIRIDVEAKLPLIFHIRINMEMNFSEYRFIGD